MSESDTDAELGKTYFELDKALIENKALRAEIERIRADLLVAQDANIAYLDREFIQQRQTLEAAQNLVHMHNLDDQVSQWQQSGAKMLDTILRLREVLSEAMEHVTHDDGCPAGDGYMADIACTCDYGDWQKKALSVLEPQP
jgi:hypothetical protein